MKNFADIAVYKIYTLTPPMPSPQSSLAFRERSTRSLSYLKLF